MANKRFTDKFMTKRALDRLNKREFEKTKAKRIAANRIKIQKAIDNGEDLSKFGIEVKQ